MGLESRIGRLEHVAGRGAKVLVFAAHNLPGRPAATVEDVRAASRTKVEVRLGRRIADQEIEWVDVHFGAGRAA